MAPARRRRPRRRRPQPSRDPRAARRAGARKRTARRASTTRKRTARRTSTTSTRTARGVSTTSKGTARRGSTRKAAAPPKSERTKIAPRRDTPPTGRTAKRPARRRPAARATPPAIPPHLGAPVTPPVAVPAPAPAPSPAERRLLDIARQLTDLGRQPGAVGRALRLLAEAYAPDAALPGAVFAAWAASRDDKTGALALAWAREQVRLALQELIERAPPRPPRRTPSNETLAWLLLAGAEAISHEPPSAAADRLRALLQLAGEEESWPLPFRPREPR